MGKGVDYFLKGPFFYKKENGEKLKILIGRNDQVNTESFVEKVRYIKKHFLNVVVDEISYFNFQGRASVGYRSLMEKYFGLTKASVKIIKYIDDSGFIKNIKLSKITN